MSKEITLYDLPSKGKCACWSFNPWKTRLALNYKGLPYTTAWTEYPDIKPTLQALGVPPDADGDYTIPAVRLPDGAGVMDSLAIAHALERLQPEPSLRLDNGYVERASKAMARALNPLRPVAVPRVPEVLLNEASRPYFYETRAEQLGMSLPEWALSEQGGEAAWRNAEPGFSDIKALLLENEGPYVAGKEVSYADFVLIGMWRCFERLDQGGDLFGRAMKYDESFPKHYEACKKWGERDDH